MNMIKGSLIDLFLIIIIIFSFAIVFLFAGFIMTEFKNVVNESDVPLNITYFEKGEQALQGFDSGLVIIAFGGLIAIIIAAFMNKIHPIFFIPAFIVFLILILIAPIFTNVFDAIATSDTLVDTANDYSLMVTFMRNIPIFALVGGIMVMIVLYGKSRGGSSEV